MNKYEWQPEGPKQGEAMSEMVHHGMSGHPADEYYECKFCTFQKIRELESQLKAAQEKMCELDNINIEVCSQRDKEKIRADGNFESYERIKVQSSALRRRVERLEGALEEVENMRAMTLLGKCCVNNECVSDEEGTACEVRLKANSAFGQAADIAKAALEETEGK